MIRRRHGPNERILTDPAPIRRLDLSGLKCPLPALRTRKALATLPPGTRLEVVCTDPMAAIDIPHLLNGTDRPIVETRREGERLVFVIGASAGHPRA